MAQTKQHLENIREMPQGKSSLSGSLNFRREQERLRDCQNLSLVSVFLLHTLDCSWVLKVVLKLRPLVGENIEILQSIKQTHCRASLGMASTNRKYIGN